MAHDFESNRPEHHIKELSHPMGHGSRDQKHDKLSRSPMMGQLPMENGLVPPANAPTLGESEGSM